MERLEAKGLIGDAYFGLRPWRRIDCLRMVEEAERRAKLDDPDEDVQQTISS